MTQKHELNPNPYEQKRTQQNMAKQTEQSDKTENYDYNLSHS